MDKVKLQISLLSLLLIPTAFAAGWWLGARSDDMRATAFKQREAEIEQVAHALHGATYINLAFKLTQISRETRSQLWKTRLFCELLDLARAEPYGAENQKETFLRHADDALGLLNVKSQDEFNRVVKNSDLVDDLKARFLDQNNDEFSTTTDFIRRAFARRSSQPSFPAKVWLDAIVNDDPGLLQTAYSDRLTTGSENWDSRIKKYRRQLVHDLGEFNQHEFSVDWTTHLNEEGEVRIHYKTSEYRVFKIIRQGSVWRLDEFWQDAETISVDPTNELAPK